MADGSTKESSITSVPKKKPTKRARDGGPVSELTSTLSTTQLNTLTSPIITILAGRAKHKFSVHENIFQNANSPALAALVSNQWKEGKDQVIDWSRTDTRIVLSVIHYLYNKAYDANTVAAVLSGRMTSKDNMTAGKGDTTQDTDSSYVHHVQVYLFADRYLLEELKTLTVKSFKLDLQLLMDTAKYTTLVKVVEYVYGSPDWFSHEGTPIHVELSHVIADQMVGEHISNILIEKFPSLAVNITLFMTPLLRHYKDEAEGYMQQIRTCASRILKVTVSCGTVDCSHPRGLQVQGREFFEPKGIVKCGCGKPLNYGFPKKSS